MKIKAQLILLLLLISSHSFGANKKINLLDAVRQDWVEFSVTRTDRSFNEKGLKLSVTNHSKHHLVITVDPALVFEANDTVYQDLILSGSEIIVISGGKTNTVDVQTYCAKSHALSPGEDLKFQYKRQGDSMLIKTFAYMKKILASKDLAQQAVWFLADRSKELNSVFDHNQPAQSQQLTIFLSQLLNVPLPVYYIETVINTTPHEIAQPSRVLKLHVKLEWDQTEEEELSLSIFDKNNKKLESYFENKRMVLGLYKLNANFETSMYEEGEYTVRLYNKFGKIIKEIIVLLK